MKTITVSQFKSHFSQVINELKYGEKIAITSGRKNKIVGYFSSEISLKPKRNLGLLEGKAKVFVTDDFKLTESDFLNP